MLRANNLQPARGARKRRQRVGRGLGSGSGVYAGRGRKGQKARSGKAPRPGFEGGQTRLEKRLPYMRGTRAAGSVMTGGPPRVRGTELNVEVLNRFTEGMEVTVGDLVQAGLVDRGPVKFLGPGKVTRPLTVRVQAFSASAREAIEQAGGKAEEIGA